MGIGGSWWVAVGVGVGVGGGVGVSMVLIKQRQVLDGKREVSSSIGHQSIPFYYRECSVC